MTARTLLCFGDSNTHGTLPMRHVGDQGRLSETERWPGVVRTALGENWRVIEEGLPGRTTVQDDPVEGAFRNGLVGLQIALNTHRPLDLLLIMLGTNDLKQRFSKPAFDIGMSVERLVTTAMAEQVWRTAPAILIVAPPPILETGILASTFAGGADKSHALSSELQAVAQRRACAFLDAGAHIESSPIDGIHYDADQHARLGAAIAGTVTAMNN